MKLGLETLVTNHNFGLLLTAGEREIFIRVEERWEYDKISSTKITAGKFIPDLKVHL